jgi:AAA family ATP:ADP antiporter
MQTPPKPHSDTKTGASRFLGMFTEVHSGEIGAVLLVSLNFFLLLGAYYILKAVRESLILSESGAEAKSYAAAGQAILLLGIVPAFSALASRIDRVRLVSGITLFFVSNLVLFIVCVRSNLQVGIAYYLWLGIFNVMAVSQFWAFANDLYTPEQGKRLFPLIGLGASLGAWVGSRAASVLVGSLGTTPALAVGAAILVVCAALIVVIDRRQTRATRMASPDQEPLAKGDAFKMVLKDRYLLLIAALVLILNVANTTGEYLLGRMVLADADKIFPNTAANLEARARFIGEFYGSFYANLNFLGIVLQAFVAGRLMKYAGVGGALMVAPILALTGYTAALFTQSLALIRSVKVVDNAFDYSVNSTAKQALFLVTTREEKYKAKTAIDTFIMRAGDVISAQIVAVGSALGAGIRAFAGANIIVCLLWLVIAAGLGLEYRKREFQKSKAQSA